MNTETIEPKSSVNEANGKAGLAASGEPLPPDSERGRH